MKTSTIVAIAALIVGSTACAHQPTHDLTDARRAYTQATDGAANQYAPVELYEAEKVLLKAERAHEDDPGSKRERDLAYVAMRRIQLAQAAAMTRKAEASEQRARVVRTKTLEEQRHLTVERLMQVESQLDEREQLLRDREQELEQAERERDAFQQRLSDATASLEGQAKVEGDAYSSRTVLVLDDEVLFRKGSARLLTPAKDSLRELASALKEHEGKPVIKVEGYTDSTGSKTSNQRLSQDRADTVRQFLVQEGVPADTVTAIGFGESNPVASNSTAEGRASNRRVEIVIEERWMNGKPVNGSGGGG